MGFYDIEWPRCYQISFLGSFLDQLIMNRFFYQAQDDYSGDLGALGSAITGDIMTNLLPWVSDDLSFSICRTLELFGDRQYDDNLLSGVVGEDNGANLPAFFGARFTLYPANTRVKKGRKIFAGITEAMVEADGYNSGYNTRVANMATILQATMTVSSIDFIPVLLSPANSRHTGDVITAIIAASWTAWSTQGSRKIGRGA